MPAQMPPAMIYARYAGRSHVWREPTDQPWDDERVFIAKSEVDRLSEQRDALLVAAESALSVLIIRGAIREGTESERIERDRLRAAIAACKGEDG